MKYCSDCGREVIQKIPENDNRLRFVCCACETIHYQNPKIIAGCIPVWEEKVLLCKRAIAPRHGYWTLPAGFMEIEETVQQAAVRETLEEANARVELRELYTVYNLPHVSQVYMMFRSELKDLNFKPGEESLETQLFTQAEIPWDEIAFKTIEQTLRHYFKERARGKLSFHLGDFIRDENREYFIEHQ